MSKRSPPLSRRIIAGSAAVLYTVGNVVFPHAAEANFWQERRRVAERQGGESGSLAAALPGSIGAERVLNQLPSLETQALAPSLPRNVSEKLPKGFAEEHASLLNALSSQYGSIRRISLASSNTRSLASSPIIVHVKDVHQNLAAQRNIAALVGRVASLPHAAGNPAMVALEGVFGPVDLSRYRSTPYKSSLKKAADFLLKENKITGPVHTLLTVGAADAVLTGVDDESHYRANVEAYRASAPRQGEIKKQLAEQSSALVARKASVFSPALKSFDEKVQAYRDGKLSLGDYVRVVSATTLPPPHPLLTKEGETTKFTSVQIFVQALEIEESINFKQVEVERRRLVEGLVKRLDEKRIQELLRWGMAYRSGAATYGDFYRYLSGLCRSAGMDLSEFPAMSEYVRYVLLADRIDAGALLTEISGRESEVYGRLAKTSEEKALVQESRRLFLTEKLADFALTPEEWKEYQSIRRHPGESRGPGVEADFQKRSHNLDSDFRRNDDKTISGLSSFEAFYKEADARDAAMADNLFRIFVVSPPPFTGEGGRRPGEGDGRGQFIPSPSPSPVNGGGKITDLPRVSVLVTGGYHSDGLEDRLTKAGCTVVTWMPKIEKADTEAGSAYLSVFTQEKTPLEQIFAGRKLYLTQNPLELASVPGILAADNPKNALDAANSVVPTETKFSVVEVVKKG